MWVMDDLLDYCTLRLQAVNDAQNVRVDTVCGKRSHLAESIRNDDVPQRI